MEVLKELLKRKGQSWTEAVLLATEDLNQPFGDEASLGQRVAECLKALGYIRVEGFNIVDRSAAPVA